MCYHYTMFANKETEYDFLGLMYNMAHKISGCKTIPMWTTASVTEPPQFEKPIWGTSLITNHDIYKRRTPEFQSSRFVINERCDGSVLTSYSRLDAFLIIVGELFAAAFAAAFATLAFSFTFASHFIHLRFKIPSVDGWLWLQDSNLHRLSQSQTSLPI